MRFLSEELEEKGKGFFILDGNLFMRSLNFRF